MPDKTLSPEEYRIVSIRCGKRIKLARLALFCYSAFIFILFLRTLFPTQSAEADLQCGNGWLAEFMTFGAAFILHLTLSIVSYQSPGKAFAIAVFPAIVVVGSLGGICYPHHLDAEEVNSLLFLTLVELPMIVLVLRGLAAADKLSRITKNYRNEPPLTT